MTMQIAKLKKGITPQQARVQVERPPEVSCSTTAECRQKLELYYGDYRPDPALKVRGPVLVYRMASIDHIHCLYFDQKQKLVEVSESAIALE